MITPFPPLSAETAHLVHFIFEWLGLLIGVQSYRILKKRYLANNPNSPQKQGMLNKGNFAVAVGCILGAGIGNKLLFLIEIPQLWEQYGFMAFAMGQTIVGGMIGGLVGIEIAKKMVGIRYSTGDLFVVPFCVGLIIGRIGCFLAGLNDGTFGVATTLPWGMDFGDGIARHPTQLYDMLWAVTMLIILKALYPKLKKVSGLSFKLLFVSYMLWRFAVDGIKPVPYEYWFGWSGIQWGCLLAVLLYLPFVVRDIKRLN
ncbi:MAG: prolipoprotein diacylglyceryl transferase [Moraxellaceae bacterium]|nr:prolipoprotein diacylglyceryl transferase [Moraxellaceae bacterium]